MTTDTPTTTSLPTDELLEGMIVRHYGARLLLEGHRTWESDHPGHTGVTVHAFAGKLLNPDDPAVDPWISYWVRQDGHWTIQGNHLARWCVEVRPVMPLCHRCGGQHSYQDCDDADPNTGESIIDRAIRRDREHRGVV